MPNSLTPQQHRRLRQNIAFTLIAGLGFSILVSALNADWVAALDRSMSELFYNAHPAWIVLSRALSTVAGGVGSLTIALVCAAYFWRSDRCAAIGLPLAVASCWAWSSVLKYSVMRERPTLEHLVHASSPSFPSGHSMVSWALPIMLAFVFTQRQPQHARKYYTAALSFALISGVARVGLGVHHFTDVIAGFCAATLIVTGFMYTYDRFGTQSASQA